MVATGDKRWLTVGRCLAVAATRKNNKRKIEKKQKIISRNCSENKKLFFFLFLIYVPNLFPNHFSIPGNRKISWRYQIDFRSFFVSGNKRIEIGRNRNVTVQALAH